MVIGEVIGALMELDDADDIEGNACGTNKHAHKYQPDSPNRPAHAHAHSHSHSHAQPWPPPQPQSQPGLFTRTRTRARTRALPSPPTPSPTHPDANRLFLFSEGQGAMCRDWGEIAAKEVVESQNPFERFVSPLNAGSQWDSGTLARGWAKVKDAVTGDRGEPPRPK